MSQDEVVSKVESIIQESEVSVPTPIAPLDGKMLAQTFIQERLKNATNLESAKAKAISILLTKIDNNSPPGLLLKVIELLDSCTSKDLEQLASISQNDKTRELLVGIIATNDKKEFEAGADQSLKSLHNIFHVLKALKNDVVKQ